MVRAVARRAMLMAIPAVLARQDPVEGIHEVVVRSGADLDDDQPSGGVRDEDRQQAVALVGDVVEEGRAGGRQVGQAAGRPGPDRQLPGVYGKMLRRASRTRPRLPPAGADS